MSEVFITSRSAGLLSSKRTSYTGDNTNKLQRSKAACQTTSGLLVKLTLPLFTFCAMVTFQHSS